MVFDQAKHAEKKHANVLSALAALRDEFDSVVAEEHLTKASADAIWEEVERARFKVDPRALAKHVRRVARLERQILRDAKEQALPDADRRALRRRRGIGRTHGKPTR